MTTVTGRKVETRKGTPVKYAITGRPPGSAPRLVGAFFGPPKTGKTTLALSGKNALHMSFDPQGDMTQTLAGRKDITVVEPADYMEVDGIVRALHTSDKGRFSFVVVDSITFMFQLFGGNEITQTYLDNKDMRRAYGRAGALTSQVINDLLRIPEAHVIFTAHIDKEHEDDPGVSTVDASLGETEVKLAVTPMVWKVLGPGVSFIGRTYKKTMQTRNSDGTRNRETQFRVSFNDGARSPAGSRIPMEGDMLIELDTLDKLATQLTKE
jgi:hypothetical protein